MRLNILIGGKAGQGINKVSEIISNILSNQGYFTFNYREYPSLIRGGHNFNILSVSDKRVGSIETKIDVIITKPAKPKGTYSQFINWEKLFFNKISSLKFFAKNFCIS